MDRNDYPGAFPTDRIILVTIQSASSREIETMFLSIYTFVQDIVSVS